MVKVVEYKDLKPTELQKKWVGHSYTNEQGHLITVVDYDHLRDYTMHYKVWCSNCSVDTEMYPQQYFTQSQDGLRLKRKLKCSCSHHFKLDMRQSKIHYGRILETMDTNYTVLDCIQRNGKLFLVLKCAVCSQDQEMFPDGSIVGATHRIVKGVKSCGCGSNYQYSEEQALILLKRELNPDDYTILGWVGGEYKGTSTKVVVEDRINDVVWDTTNVYNILKGGRYGLKHIKPYDEAMSEITELCRKRGDLIVGFSGEYKGLSSRMMSICKNWHHRYTTIGGFMKCGCLDCYNLENSAIASGYYLKRLYEEDFLYVILFDNEYIKIGRTFDITKRFDSLRYESKSKNVTLLNLYSGTHMNIRNLEKALHRELYKKKLHHKESSWSKETFLLSTYNQALDFINNTPNITDTVCDIIHK